MPVWTVNEPDLSVWLRDLPLFYQPSRGPQIRFELVYKDGTDSTGEDAMSQQFMFGEHWSSPWRCYILTNSGGAVVFVNGLGGQTTLTAGTPTYRYELTFGATNGVPWIDSPSGARDVFGQNFTDANGHTRSYLTQRYDPSGNAVLLQYSTTNSGTVMLLDRIIDAGGLTNTFAYTNTGAYFMVSKITDPFNATALFEYDYDGINVPQLTAITDAAQLRTTISFDGQTLKIKAFTGRSYQGYKNNIMPVVDGQGYAVVMEEEINCGPIAPKVQPVTANGTPSIPTTNETPPPQQKGPNPGNGDNRGTGGGGNPGTGTGEH